MTTGTEDYDPGIHGPRPQAPPVVAEKPIEDAFEVQFGVGGPVHPVPAGVPLLDVLLDAGADVMFSCREGTCGSCETPLLAGRADHRDHLLRPAERAADDRIFPCVSRALSDRLVLDLPAPG
jgi:tetrachlorobenzoquinone reductase